MNDIISNIVFRREGMTTETAGICGGVINDVIHSTVTRKNNAHVQSLGFTEGTGRLKQMRVLKLHLFT